MAVLFRLRSRHRRDSTDRSCKGSERRLVLPAGSAAAQSNRPDNGALTPGVPFGKALHGQIIAKVGCSKTVCAGPGHGRMPELYSGIGEV